MESPAPRISYTVFIYSITFRTSAPISEGATEILAAGVEAGRVLRAEEAKVSVRADALAGLGQEQLAVVSEHPVERLEDLTVGEVQLVEHEPVALAHRAHQGALSEHETASRLVPSTGVWDVAPDVVLEVRVLVVVQPDAHVSSHSREILHHRSFADRRLALERIGNGL